MAGRVSTRWSDAVLACPKSMHHGPCAGVSETGECEVAGFGRCSFVDLDPASWPYGGTASAGFGYVPARAPLVIADLPAAALSAASVREVAGLLVDRVDACLLGDHGLARVQYPPSYRARLLADAGVPAWVGLHCRDRNRVALEGEIAACLDAGVAGLHCVTGDHPARGGRPDAMPVFDLDAVGLVQLAAGRGVPCSVAHAPSAPPRAIRLPRLLAKLAAGADTVFIDHCGGPDDVAAATAQVRAAGFTGRVIACVPIVVDAESARVLLSYAADTVPNGYVEQIMVADDPMSAGVAAATRLCTRLLATPGLDGVNLSGGGMQGAERSVAAAMAEIADGVRGAALPAGAGASG